MKRFYSPLQKIQRLQHQQLRLAELSVLQARQQVADCEERLEQLRVTDLRQQSSIQKQFDGGTATVALETLKSCFACRSVTEEQADLQRQHLVVHQQHVKTAEVKYRELKARCQGTDDLIEQKMKAHRTDTFRKQQVELEDGARSVEIVNRRSAERNSEL